jgi:hypothetical protein
MGEQDPAAFESLPVSNTALGARFVQSWAMVG